MSRSEGGDFEGGETITVADLRKQRADAFGYVAASEVRLDNANVIVLPNSAVVHRTPPTNPYVKVERDGRDLFGTFHGLSGGGLERPQRIAGVQHTTLNIDVGDGYYTVWGADLEKDLRR